jgi:hypothetical protein
MNDIHWDSWWDHQIQGERLSSREPVTFSIFRVFCTRNRMFSTPRKTVILSEAPRGSIPYQTAYGAESKDPSDACWQMLFQAFQPRTTSQIKKVTSSERSNPSHAPLRHPHHKLAIGLDLCARDGILWLVRDGFTLAKLGSRRKLINDGKG